jgi:hypothetical protein
MPPQEQCLFASVAEEEEQHVTTAIKATMKPQHEQQQQKSSDDERFINAPTSHNKITAPCFRLGAWGDAGATGEPSLNLPFVFPESTTWDNDDDDSQSCDWSVASSEDSSVYWDANAKFENSESRVRFCPDLVSDVRHYTKPCHEDCKNMYYTAHELQRMIDDFVRAGGTTLLSPA